MDLDIGIDPDNAGRYRDIQLRISGTTHIPPEPLQVPSLMKKMVREMAGGTDHPVVQASRVHFELVSIHPFVFISRQ